MDRQKMFDRAWHYYVTEGHPPSIRGSHDNSTSESPNCVYFDEETKNRCAIGIQLTPEQAARMPRGPIFALLKNNWPEAYSELRALYGVELGRLLGVEREEDIDFLTRLQDAHDHAAALMYGFEEQFPELFTENMRTVAAHWNLTVPGEAAPEAATEEEEMLCAQ